MDTDSKKHRAKVLIGLLSELENRIEGEESRWINYPQNVTDEDMKELESSGNIQLRTFSGLKQYRISLPLGRS